MAINTQTYHSDGEHKLALALGRISNLSKFSKFGRNGDIDILTTPEDVWAGGGVYTGQPTGAPETITCTSTDATDAAAGTGMRTLTLVGLKTSDSTTYESEVITLNGVTGVVSSSTWYRILSVRGETFGSGQINAGSITVQHTTTTANIFCVIQPNIGRSQISVFTMVAGSTGYLSGLNVQMARANGAAGSAQILVLTRKFGSGGYTARTNHEITQAMKVIDLGIPMQLEEKMDLMIRVQSVSDNNTIVTATFDVIYEAN